VLILDEFLFLEELRLTHAFHEIGKRVMTWPSTLFVLASSAPAAARTILRERLQLLFGQFELLTLDSLDAGTAMTWVQQELRGLRGAKALAPFVIRWLGGSPWYLAVFLKRFKELAALRKKPEGVEPLFLETAWDLLGSREGALFQWCASRTEELSHLRHGARAVDALVQLAEGARTSTDLGRRIGRSGVSGALQLLLDKDFLQRKGTCWLIPDALLRCWLTAVFSAQRSGAPPEGRSLRGRFERYLMDAWMQWVQSTQISFSEQMIQLLHKFQDDTVSLDAKAGRLPRFTAVRSLPNTTAPGTYLVADGADRRWCCTVHEGPLDESAIATFDAFCRVQIPKPSRKVVITKTALDENARLLAKAKSMWVWQGQDLEMLVELYGATPAAGSAGPPQTAARMTGRRSLAHA
jgi:hypothetical protein